MVFEGHAGRCPLRVPGFLKFFLCSRNKTHISYEIVMKAKRKRLFKCPAANRGDGVMVAHWQCSEEQVRILGAPPKTNPYTMKHFLQENLIYLPFALMAILVLLFAGWALYEFAKKEKPVLSDDLPGHYEDYEVSERPFIEYFN